MSAPTPKRCENRRSSLALRKIDEVRPDPAFGEESQCLARVGTLPGAEDLDLHRSHLLSPRAVRIAGPACARTIATNLRGGFQIVTR